MGAPFSLESPKMNSNHRAYLAEAVGTFVLVFTGCGSAILDGDKIGVLGVSIAFGLAVVAMIYALGPISGCHINPAVTLALWMTKKFEGRHVAAYMACQIIGGILGAGVLLIIAKGAVEGHDPVISGFACTGYGEHSPAHYSLAAGFVEEVVLTMLLTLTILGSTDVKAPLGFAGLAIGLVVVLALLTGIPVTGCSMNPARSIATAVYVRGWALAQLWLFIVGPFAGAIVGAILYQALRERTAPFAEQHAVQSTPRQQSDRFAAGDEVAAG
jgi:aquaporin Z